ncbi:hypothetical protein BGX38DRAFT_1147125 [Terfezia claveryi]|nr:hypothetical protein BGX38DRAFT_1147125 [Terfezia claveryi]
MGGQHNHLRNPPAGSLHMCWVETGEGKKKRVQYLLRLSFCRIEFKLLEDCLNNKIKIVFSNGDDNDDDHDNHKDDDWDEDEEGQKQGRGRTKTRTRKVKNEEKKDEEEQNKQKARKNKEMTTSPEEFLYKGGFETVTAAAWSTAHFQGCIITLALALELESFIAIYITIQ